MVCATIAMSSQYARSASAPSGTWMAVRESLSMARSRGRCRAYSRMAARDPSSTACPYVASAATTSIPTWLGIWIPAMLSRGWSGSDTKNAGRHIPSRTVATPPYRLYALEM
ncbi:MAG: hypothetical protein ACOH16_04210 [Propionibacteriaceae bacterium]